MKLNPTENVFNTAIINDQDFCAVSINTRTVMNSSYMQLYHCVYGNGNGREWEC